MRGARHLSISILGIALALMATATLTAASLAQDTGFAGKLIRAEAMAGGAAGGARLGRGGKGDPGSRGRNTIRRMGPFAGRAGGFVHRPRSGGLCAGIK